MNYGRIHAHLLMAEKHVDGQVENNINNNNNFYICHKVM